MARAGGDADTGGNADVVGPWARACSGTAARFGDPLKPELTGIEPLGLSLTDSHGVRARHGAGRVVHAYACHFSTGANALIPTLSRKSADASSVR